MEHENPNPPFTYNIDRFTTEDVDIDTSQIPVYADEAAARAAGHVEGDIFRTPDGRLGLVGVIPKDGRE